MTHIGRFFLFCGVLLCGASTMARADEFSPLPANDPILKSLSGLDVWGDGAKFHTSGSVTRYEAALQVTRVLARAQNSAGSLSKPQWRKLSGLLKSLAPELKTLGIDLAEAQALCEKNLSISASTSEKKKQGLSLATREKTGATAFSSPLLTPDSVGAPFADDIKARAATLPISNRLRVGAALLSMERAQNDPFEGARTLSRPIGSGASIAYDLNSWLTLRANTQARELENGAALSPLLSAPLFAGTQNLKSQGGGLDVNLGQLSLAAGLEKFSGERGTLGTKIGGGAQISAWENRLSLSAHMSRLLPEDRAALPATAAEFGVGARVTERLSLNLMYQGLFTAQSKQNTERVAGGLSLSF